jgi:hypothetical protein
MSTRLRRLGGWPRRLLNPRAEWVARDVGVRLEQRLDELERTMNGLAEQLGGLEQRMVERDVEHEKREIQRFTELLREQSDAVEGLGARGHGLAALLDAVRGVQDELLALRWEAGSGEGDPPTAAGPREGLERDGSA